MQHRRPPFANLVLALAALALLAPALPAADIFLRTEDLGPHPECAYCGMDRRQWSHTRHLVEYADGTAEGTCSLRCAATSLIAHGREAVTRVSGADAGSSQVPAPLVQVDQLTYVVDPEQRGTMTAVRKWAYASKVTARRALSPKGRLTDFAGALEAAAGEIGRQRGEAVMRARPARRRR